VRTLRGRFGLALGVVLLAATTVPVLALYLLGASGLVEATYVSEQGDARQDLAAWAEFTAPDIEPPGELIPAYATEGAESLGADLRGPTATAVVPSGGGASVWPLAATRLDAGTDRQPPFLSINPDTGLWTTRIGPNLQRIEIAAPVFRFRVDLPAWIVIASLPMLGIAIGLVLSVSLSRSVTQPVSELAQAARAIGQRELGYRVKSRGSRELADLAESFNRMAEALERAEAVRRNLVADVAHELRTPLTVLEGNLRAMLDGVRPLNEEGVATLVEETHHLNRLVDDLRLLSQSEADRLPLSLTQVNLADLIQKAVAPFSPLAEERGIRMRFRLEGDLVHPRLDADRVTQVIHNLVANALGHTPNGGQVTISACRMEDLPGLRLAVEDTGEGMPPEALEHVFDRFYRTSPSRGRDRGGAGLGLAIVRAIVQAHGGSVTAESEGLGRGSRFHVILPIGSETEAAAPARAHNES
jgi:signal transduction histidine kinase